MNIRRMKRSPFQYCAEQLVASTATAQSGSLLILLLPSLLSLICSLSRRLAAPQWILFHLGTVCILEVCSGPVLLLQGYIVKSPLWIRKPRCGRCPLGRSRREDHDALQSCKCASQTSAAI